MFDWFNLADRLMVGVPVMLGVIACVLLMARAEEHWQSWRLWLSSGKRGFRIRFFSCWNEV